MTYMYLGGIVLLTVFIFGAFAWLAIEDPTPYAGQPDGEEAQEIARRLGLGPQDENGERDDTRRAVRRFGNGTVGRL